MKLFDGTGFLLYKTRAKVVTCYLRGAHRLPFLAQSEPEKMVCRASPPISATSLTPPQLTGMSTVRARQKLTRWLYDTMVKQQFDIELAAAPKNVLAAIVQTARQFPGVVALEDVTHKTLTYRRLLAGADALADQWRRQWPGDTPRARGRGAAHFPGHAGDPAQPVAGGKDSGHSQLFHRHLHHARLRPARRAQTNHHLQNISGAGQIESPADAGRRHRVHLFGGRPRQNLALAPMAAPSCASLFYPQSPSSRPTEPQGHSHSSAVVLFTSGSEGTPKGVELTHANLLANVRQLLAVLDVTDADRLFNCLPLFHSFGIICLSCP